MTNSAEVTSKADMPAELFRRMRAPDKRRAVRVGFFGIALGAWAIGVSVYGFVTDQAEKLFGTNFWVWVSRAEDPALYWISNSAFFVMGVLMVTGSSMIVWKALRDPDFPLPPRPPPR